MLRAKLLFGICAGLVMACGGGGGGKIMADLPEGVLPYEAPDIDEITGIEPVEEGDTGDDAPASDATPAPAPAPAPEAATPAKPAPAKPAPAKPAPAKKAPAKAAAPAAGAGSAPAPSPKK